MAETDALAEAVVAVKNETDSGAEAHTQSKAAGGATSKVDWKADVPEDIRKSVDKYETPADLAKGYSALVAKLGQTVQVPGSDATAEERKAFYRKLGRPESPDEYELSGVVLPEGVPREPDADKEFKSVMADLDLTKDQAKRLHEWAMKKAVNNIVNFRSQAKKNAESFDSALRTTWGVDYDKNMAASERVMKLMGDKAIQRFNNGLGKDPVIREGLYAISKLMADETLESGRIAEPEKTSQGMIVDFTKDPTVTGKNRYNARG